MGLLHRTNHHHGISVVGVLISMTIISLMAGMAGFNLLGQAPNYRLNGAMRMLAWELMALRMQALREKHDITVTFISDSQYKIWNDRDDDDSPDMGEEHIKNIQEKYADVTFTASPNSTTFSTTGAVPNPLAITLVNTAGTKNITVTIAGMIKVN
jgi:hypothetical protein